MAKDNLVKSSWLRHRVESLDSVFSLMRVGLSAGLQPAMVRWSVTWGVAPGYDSAGLQPAMVRWSVTWGVAPGYDNAGLQPAMVR
jgi:hypothetical protein